MRPKLPGDVIAIDGKTERRTHDRAIDLSPLHIVSAWSTANSLVLGQGRTADKSNEITAIPLLLEMLDLQGCVITIDALGCQVAIAEQIVAQEADYVLACKGNQGHLARDIGQNTSRPAQSLCPVFSVVDDSDIAAPHYLLLFCMRELQFAELRDKLLQECAGDQNTERFHWRVNYISAVMHAFDDVVWEQADFWPYYADELPNGSG